MSSWRTSFCAWALAAAAAFAAPMRETPYVGAIAIDANSGRTLFARSADRLAYPASIAKLMTAFIVLDDVAAGRYRLEDEVVASAPAGVAGRYARQPSCVGLKPGERMSVDTLLTVMLVHSANDAAVFLAEKSAGSVEAFVGRMNAKARELGMKDTVYYNPNGLPPWPNARVRNFNVSTCKDLAIMARALLARHPEILRYTSIKVCPVKLPGGQVQNFVNHNTIMVKNKWKVINPDGTEAVDGLKTGYIDAGGSSVVITGRRGKNRVIVVVLGSSTRDSRDSAARQILTDALEAVSW